MRRSVTLLAGFIALFGLLSACTVAFEETPTTPGVFKCETDEDCIGPNQICDENKDGTKVCVEDTGSPDCVDEDEDGWGSSGDLSKCGACQNSSDFNCFYDCCKKDCNDDNKAIHPGQVDQCDTKDNNCDGVVDKPGSVGCTDSGDCALSGTPRPQDKTKWICSEIDGTSQCVLIGNFSSPEACRMNSAYGKCINGEWTKVPDMCTM